MEHKTSMDTANLVRKTTRLEIRDLTADVLVLVFSLLHGQDIARCTRVCRYFGGLIHSVLYLQYKIELAQNGMVDGDSSILPVSQRLQRLRQYSSNFYGGVFDHEDLAAYPDYVLRIRNLGWNVAIPAESSFSDLYSRGGRSNFSLSVYTPRSAQAGIQSSRCILPIGAAGGSGLLITKWAIDGAQDLLVMGEIANIGMPEQLQRRLDEVHFHFYSLSGSKATRPTPHPAARLPSVNVLAPAEIHNNIQPMANVVALYIAGQYVIWELVVRRGEIQSVFVDVCNWRTGDVISRIDVGMRLVHVVPLGHPYLLVIPKTFEDYPHLNIYSIPTSDTPNHIICTLRLPSENLEPDERVVWHEVYGGDRPYTSGGHFRADLSLAMVVLTFYIRGPQRDHETHYLVPRATFLAQIRAAELRQTDTDTDSGKAAAQSGSIESVPWADWGPQGCLRLRLGYARLRRAALIPFCSRMPLVVFDDGPESGSASVFVFDISPLAARRARQGLAARRRNDAVSPELVPGSGTDPESAGIVENIEEVLPGVVDPDCSRIPFVAYRFKLPDDPGEWQFGHTICSVVMSMTGFMVKFAAAEYERTVQTWTV
ncbi:hypothetical protein V8D89_006802 [Ganoderma adspersum]